MKILPAMLSAACENSFDAHMFRIFYRARRNFAPYLRRLLQRLEAENRPQLALTLCRNVCARQNAPRFQARLTELEAELASPKPVRNPLPDQSEVSDPV